jgi:hypothetical protein
LNGLSGKHFLQGFEDGGQRFGRHCALPVNQGRFIHRPYLIEQNQAVCDLLAMVRAASAHPARTGPDGRRSTMAPSATDISALSVPNSPARTGTGLGHTTPLPGPTAQLAISMIIFTADEMTSYDTVK